MYTSIVIGSDGQPLVSYMGEENVLEVLHCNNTGASAVCSSDSIDLNTLDGDAYVTWTSVIIGADGLGLVAYYDAQRTSFNVVHCDDLSCKP